MRISKAHIAGMFRRLVFAMYKNINGDDCPNLGLDYFPEDGGYIIVEFGINGIERHPFGLVRRSTREMYLSMMMAAEALENIETKEE